MLIDCNADPYGLGSITAVGLNASSYALYVVISYGYGLSAPRVCCPVTQQWLMRGRGAVRLFSEFYQSDIIVASPLAVATLLGEPPAEGEAGAVSDFLSSIEVAVVMRADVMSMQNWAHVKLGARPWM